MGIAADRLKNALAAKGLRYCGTRGDIKAPVLILGEAPGENEDREGIPFVGASGQELTRMVADAGLDARDIWYTNTYKARPPANDIDRRAELGIEESLFTDQILEELHETKPTIIIAAGGTAQALLCPETCSKKDGKAKIGLWRGSLIRSNKLNWPHYIIPMYHPAFVLREWSERQIAVFCLARAAEELVYYKAHGKLQPLPERKFLIEPSFDDLRGYLNDCLLSTNPISHDIETVRRKYPYTTSLAISRASAVSFSLWNYQTDHLGKIWRLLDQILRTKKQIGQNYLGFDCGMLETLGFRPTSSLVSDTMVKHHVLWPEFEHKLQFLTFQYTREPYYKDEGRQWRPKEGIRPLLTYGAKDSAVTYEVSEEQDKELDARGLRKFYENYEQRLASAFYAIEKRGVLVDKTKLAELASHINQELLKSCTIITQQTKKATVASKEAGEKLRKDLQKPDLPIFNLNAPIQVITELKALGLKIPKKRGTGKESSDAETLETLYAATGNATLKEILRVRELNKIKGTYVEAKLLDDVLYCSYVVTGTVTGRRSSRTNLHGYGTNLQNQPKHSDLGAKYRKCLVARPGKIYISCDQISAEDWLVQGIIADQSGDRRGLDELLNPAIDRHTKLACFLFAKPASDCHKKSVERFLGKKTRHAGNYDMRANRMSSVMAQEGFTINEKTCDYLLGKFHEFDPGIRTVFHQYIQQELSSTRRLRTPLGRERYFMALRTHTDNTKIFKEAYSYIPQSTVGDNTGLAILYIEDEWPGIVLMDTHDAVTCEVNDTDEDVIKAMELMSRAFDREIVFPNGLVLKIPIEFELGYNQYDTKAIHEIRYEKGLDWHDSLKNPGLIATLASFRERARAQSNITIGQA